MSTPPGLLDPPGEEIAIEALRVPKARQFAEYLRQVGPEAFAELLETRQVAEPPAEAIVFRVSVERPQQTVYSIRSVETLAAIFALADNILPEVLALRSDFPLTPHTNIRKTEFPRSLCLFEQAFEIVRLTWTPAGFLQRIRLWLSKTATGTLHGADQPLEPLIQGSPCNLIVPSDFVAQELYDKPRLMDVFRTTKESAGSTFLGRWRDPASTRKVHSIAVAFSCPPQMHGVMRHSPQTLHELHDLCFNSGLDLAGALAATIRGWYLDKPAPDVLNAQLIIIVVLPKTRRVDGPVESTEVRAFLTLISVAAVGAALSVIDNRGSIPGYVIGSAVLDLNPLDVVRLHLVQVLRGLNASAAAMMNGDAPSNLKIVAIGVGAFGSQVVNNLVRAGFGRWSLIDPDTFLPHNAARHLLPIGAIGQNKAEAVATAVNSVLDDAPMATALPVDVLHPGDHEQQATSAFSESDLIVDFSASIAVPRYLAKSTNKARHLSAFVTPKGDGLVLTIEDSKRSVRLDWLEMLHYRAVLNEPSLRDSLQSLDSHLRYGNGCRDVTTLLAQDDIAIWAGITSKEIKRLVETDKAVIRIFQAASDGAVKVLELPISETIMLRLYDWTICFDQWLIAKLGDVRKGKLPNETGGVLLGTFDTHAKTCSIIDFLPSTPDSTEWPTTYIRGCQGLSEKVEAIKERLLGQIGYVGEWHSHPKFASVRPSEADLQAYAWLTGHMHADALPGIMLIVGEGNHFSLVSHAPGE